MSSGPRGPLHVVGRVDPFTVDVVAAAGMLVVSEVVVWTTPHLRVPAAHALWAVLVMAAVAVRRRWLLEATVVIAVATVAIALTAGGDGFQGPAGFIGAVALVLITYGAGAFLEGARSVLALAVVLAITSTIALTSPDQVVANLVWDTAISGVLPWLVGRIVRDRSARAAAAQERAERMDSEHEYHARAAALAERARLAREIHDVIAHSVSVMVIQAAGARAVMDREPARAEASLRSVERAGGDALAEMRRLLGILGDHDELRALAPQPSLDDLDDLVSRTRAAGLATSLHVEGDPVSVPPGLSLCAYRVVQEALTNTIKHAGEARAEVRVRWATDALELEVVDDGPGWTGPPSTAGGHGLVGMRERASMHGGTVEVGPARGGGFSVRASIPLAERVAA